jgi:fibronectin type 3 domain-containing protein
VKAYDAAGNLGSAQIKVTYSPPAPIPPPAPVPAPTQNSVSLTWDANTEPDLAGYRIYYGISPGSYSQAPGQGSYTASNAFNVTGLTSGLRYYFAVTAIDRSGNESGYSVEVLKDIP